MKKKENKLETIERLYGKDFGISDIKLLAKELRKYGFPTLAKIFIKLYEKD